MVARNSKSTTIRLQDYSATEGKYHYEMGSFHLQTIYVLMCDQSCQSVHSRNKNNGFCSDYFKRKITFYRNVRWTNVTVIRVKLLQKCQEIAVGLICEYMFNSLLHIKALIKMINWCAALMLYAHKIHNWYIFFKMLVYGLLHERWF